MEVLILARSRQRIGCIRGPRGPAGAAGATGSDGDDGVTFTPSVSNEGVLSWTNDGGLPNPASVNIKGPTGATGNVNINIVNVSSYNDLPGVNDANTPSTSTLYFVLTRSGDSNHDEYDEYIWNSTANKYEKIGSGTLSANLTASSISNDSSVSGTNVDDALDTLKGILDDFNTYIIC